jgi:hypothetical protein
MRKLLTLIALTLTLSVTAQAQQNLALDSQATASASSTIGPGFPASSVIDGDRSGYGWAVSGGGWNDATRSAFPDSLTVTLARQYSIGRVTLYTLQDSFGSPVEPSPTQTCALYGVRDFDVEVLTGSGWTQVASVTGNNLCARSVAFPAVRGTAVRVSITASNDGLYSRVVELEVFNR